MCRSLARLCNTTTSRATVTVSTVQLVVKRQMKELGGQLHAHTDGDVIVVLDLEPDSALLARRTARELVNASRSSGRRWACSRRTSSRCGTRWLAVVTPAVVTGVRPRRTARRAQIACARRHQAGQAAARQRKRAETGARNGAATPPGKGKGGKQGGAGGKKGAAAQTAVLGTSGTAAADGGGAAAAPAQAGTAAELRDVVEGERAFLDDALAVSLCCPPPRGHGVQYRWAQRPVCGAAQRAVGGRDGVAHHACGERGERGGRHGFW